MKRIARSRVGIYSKKQPSPTSKAHLILETVRNWPLRWETTVLHDPRQFSTMMAAIGHDSLKSEARLTRPTVDIHMSENVIMLLFGNSSVVWPL